MKQAITLITLLTTLLLNAQPYFPPAGAVFNDEQVAKVEITIDEDDLIFIYENVFSNEEHPATFIFHNGEVSDTIENVGFRLRGNTSRASAKKSFKVSFNTFEEGGKFYGLEKLNLNGEHNDPTIARAKICWDLARDLGIPAPRANHTELYINGDYFGLYVNVEHIDEEFAESRFGNKNGNLYKCLYPSSLEYLGSNPNSYMQEGYQLKTNLEENDYSDLIHFIEILNNTSSSNLACELENVFNVNDYLKSIVLDILTANWDGPLLNKNNFYLYHNTETDRFEYIPYDLDNTLGIDWFSEDWASRNIYNWAADWEPRPLYDKIMSVLDYRHRFSYFFSQALEELVEPSQIENSLEALRQQLAPYAENDEFRTYDYDFDYDDFYDNFEDDIEMQGNDHVTRGILEYFELRRSTALNQLNQSNFAPIINYLSDNKPLSNDDIVITAFIQDEQAVSVNLVYRIDGGDETILTMNDDGIYPDWTMGDGIYSVSIPPTNVAALIEYRVEASDTENASDSFPCDWQTQQILEPSTTLFINEFMASNNTVIADENGEYDDWIELYNGGEEAIYLGDKYISDNLNNPDKFQLPDQTLEAGDFLLIWADEDGSQGPNHANFKLSKDGEIIALFDAEGNIIDRVQYGAQTSDFTNGYYPDGANAILPLIPTPEASNILSATNIESPSLSTHQLQVFPNPCIHQCQVTIPDFEGLADLHLYNLQGSCVYTKKVVSNDVNLSVDFLKGGLYLLQLEQKGQLIGQGKIVVNQ